MLRKLSPCNKICEIDYRTGLCVGCFRNLEEISAWSRMSDRERAKCMQELETRNPLQGKNNVEK
jgi:predicted Fe-S protein YdhL (DUF1289 family)